MKFGDFAPAELAFLFSSWCVRADVSCAARQPNRRRRRKIDCSSIGRKQQLAGAFPCEMKFGTLLLLKLHFVVSVVASILFLLLLPMLFVSSGLFFRFVSLRVSQNGNNISVAVACHLIACILHNPNLTELYLDHAPSACVAHDAWRSEGLPVLSAGVVATEWTAVLKSLREVSMQNVFF